MQINLDLTVIQENGSRGKEPLNYM